MTNPRALDEINRKVATRKEAEELSVDQLQRRINDYFFMGDKRYKYRRASNMLAKAFKDATREEMEEYREARRVKPFTRRGFKEWWSRDIKGRFTKLVYRRKE